MDIEPGQGASPESGWVYWDRNPSTGQAVPIPWDWASQRLPGPITTPTPNEPYSPNLGTPFPGDGETPVPGYQMDWGNLPPVPIAQPGDYSPPAPWVSPNQQYYNPSYYQSQQSDDPGYDYFEPMPPELPSTYDAPFGSHQAVPPEFSPPYWRPEEQ